MAAALAPFAPLLACGAALAVCVVTQPDPADDFMREVRGLPPLPALGYLPAPCFAELLWTMAAALLTLAGLLLCCVAGPRAPRD